jgi:hypothetical protein
MSIVADIEEDSRRILAVVRATITVVDSQILMTPDDSVLSHLPLLKDSGRLYSLLPKAQALTCR